MNEGKKGTMASCEWSPCSTSFIKKKDGNKHRFCSDSCRKKSNRYKKGQPLIPSFISNKNRSYPAYTSQPSIQGYEGQKPAFKLGLSLLGLGIGVINDLGTIGTAAATAIGYYIGKQIEDSLPSVQYAVPQHPTSSNYIPQTPTKNSIEKRIMTGSEYRYADIESIGLRGEYNYLMGDPSEGFYMLLTGSPGHGKSTFATKFSQYFKLNHGKVLYLASEQSGLNKPLQELFKRYSVTFNINTKPTSKVSEIIADSRKYNLLVIDSVNNLRLTPDDIRAIKKANPTLSIIAIMQSTKDGNFKGSQEFLHDCDIRINCVRPYAEQLKSRYAPPSKILIFDNDKGGNQKGGNNVIWS